MKKHFLFLLIVFLLAIPFTASADIIENVMLNEGYYSSFDGKFHFPNLGTYNVYDNYTATISGGTKIENGTYESFCVEDAWTTGINNTYTVLSIDKSLSGFGLNVDDFFRASWVAETYYNIDKEAAQIAIWEIMFDDGYNISTGNFYYVSGVTDATIANATNYLLNAMSLQYDNNFHSN